MSERMMARMMAPLARSIGNMLARGTVVLANSASKMQTLQVRLLSGEAKESVEHFEPYGYTSRPLEGAEHVTVFFGGDRSHGVTLMVADRRYRLQGLLSGEVALHDDLGTRLVLKRGGVIEIVASTKVRMVTPLLEVTGEIKDLCDTTGKTMSNMRSIYNGHTHTDPQGGTTGTPSASM